MIASSFLFNRTSTTGEFSFAALTIYFTLIGLGYLLIELSQMQRLGIFLGHPIYSLTTTLFTFLFCSGFGSLFSHRIQKFIVRTNGSIAMGFFLLILLLSGFLTEEVIAISSGLDLTYRIIISFCLLSPAAFFMGIMLPIGLSYVPPNDQNSKAWLWGINGASSVVS